MTRQHEKVLIATLAAIVILCAAAFVVTPTRAAGSLVPAPAQVTAPLDMSHF